MLHTLLLHKEPILSGHFTAQMAKISPPDYSLSYSIAHKSKAPKCTMYTWAVMQMWSHTPAPRCTQRDTNTDGHTRLQMQQDAKQTHTLGFGVLVSILSLPFSVSLGGLAVVIWHTAAVAAVLFYACGDASLLVCILYVWLYVCPCMAMCTCVFLYVSLPFAWIPFLPPRCCAVLPSECVI